MSNKILSVSIAAYNVEEYLRDCLDSLVKIKKIDKLDILVIDDGSKDSTKEIAKEYEALYPNVVRLVSKENGGWGSTVNLGIRLAQGKYFKLLDGDDMIDTSTLDGLLDYLEETNTDLLFTVFEEFDHKTGETIEYKYLLDKNKYHTGKQYKISELPKDFFAQMHSIIVKTSIIQGNNVSIIEGCFYTDIEFVLKCINYSNHFEVCDLNVYRYRVSRGGQSVSIEGVRKHYKDHIKALKRNIMFVEDTAREEAKMVLRYRVKCMFESQWVIFFMLEPTKTHKRDLIDLEKFIKNNYNVYYPISWKKVKLLRMTKYILYTPIVKYALKNNVRNTI